MKVKVGKAKWAATRLRQGRIDQCWPQ
jgi:hypothetical protein